MRLPTNGQAATLQGGVSAGEFRPGGEVSAQPSTCADGSRWSDLLGLLVDPDHPARLLAPTSHDNAPHPVSEGPADALLLEAERLGGLAVVAPIRPDLVAVDLDGCAALMLPGLLDAAEHVGGVLVYLAASGSHDSRHAVIGCPTSHGRARLLELLDLERAGHGLDRRAVDHRQGLGGALRLPGSVALKTDGGPVVPVDLEGRRLGALEAARRAREALASVGLPECPASAAEAASGPDRRPDGARLAVVDTDDDGAPVVRAWRPRRAWTDAERALLNARPARGARSDAALEAARMLWARGVRDWSEARRYYRRAPVFSKYRTRADGGRSHWCGVARSAAAYRGPVDGEAARRCEGWLEAAARWTAHDEAAALAAVIWHRFADGRGLERRPIAVRDLVGWLGCSVGRAHGLLEALRGRGALVRVRAHEDGPACEAALYSLGAVPSVQAAEGVESGEHELTPPMCGPLDPVTVLAPVWTVLGQGARALWGLLGASALPAAALAAAAGLSPGRAGRSGARLLLERLEACGLAVRCAGGWRRGAAGLEAAGCAVGAAAVVDRVRRRVLAERAGWHARTDEARAVAGRALAVLRSVRPARVALAGAARAAGAVVDGSRGAAGASVGGGGSAGVWRASSGSATRAGPG